MAKTYPKQIGLNQTIEFSGKLPLDNRTTVENLGDLYGSSMNPYKGLITYVEGADQMYVYDTAASWRPLFKYQYRKPTTNASDNIMTIPDALNLLIDEQFYTGLEDVSVSVEVSPDGLKRGQIRDLTYIFTWNNYNDYKSLITMQTVEQDTAGEDVSIAIDPTAESYVLESISGNQEEVTRIFKFYSSATDSHHNLPAPCKVSVTIPTSVLTMTMTSREPNKVNLDSAIFFSGYISEVGFRENIPVDGAMRINIPTENEEYIYILYPGHVKRISLYMNGQSPISAGGFTRLIEASIEYYEERLVGQIYRSDNKFSQGDYCLIVEGD